MTKPKPKSAPLTNQPPNRTSKIVASRPLSPRDPEATSANQAPVLIPAPPGLYAVLVEDGDNVSLSPVIALKYECEKMLAFIAREDEIVPINEIEMFEKFYWGDPDDFNAEASDKDDDDDDDDDDDENDDENDENEDASEED